jgi:hypothetical protein
VRIAEAEAFAAAAAADAAAEADSSQQPFMICLDLPPIRLRGH